MSVKCELSHTTFVKQEWKKPVDRMKEYICREVQTENGGYLEIETELIRCKDCTSCLETKLSDGQRWNYCGRLRCVTEDDGFCCWAERMYPKIKAKGTE